MNRNELNRKISEMLKVEVESALRELNRIIDPNAPDSTIQNAINERAAARN